MWWFNKICALGVRKPLEAGDLYPLNIEDTSKILVAKWEKLWTQAMSDYNERKSNAIQRSRAPSMSNEANTTEEEDGTAPLLAANAVYETGAYGSLPQSETTPPMDVEPPSIIWRLFLLFKQDIISAMIIKCFSDLLLFANPQLLRY